MKGLDQAANGSPAGQSAGEPTENSNDVTEDDPAPRRFYSSRSTVLIEDRIWIDRKKENTRSYLALAVMAAVIGVTATTVVAIFISSPAEAAERMLDLLKTLLFVLGITLGYYFGIGKNDGGS